MGKLFSLDYLIHWSHYLHTLVTYMKWSRYDLFGGPDLNWVVCCFWFMSGCKLFFRLFSLLWGVIYLLILNVSWTGSLFCFHSNTNYFSQRDGCEMLGFRDLMTKILHIYCLECKNGPSHSCAISQLPWCLDIPLYPEFQSGDPSLLILFPNHLPMSSSLFSKPWCRPLLLLGNQFVCPPPQCDGGPFVF